MYLIIPRYGIERPRALFSCLETGYYTKPRTGLYVPYGTEGG